MSLKETLLNKFSTVANLVLGSLGAVRNKLLSALLICITFTASVKGQINLPLGNVLNLNTSSNFLYLETRILFNTGIYKADDYCWNKISDSIDTRWVLSSCFNGDCRNDLLQSGCFIKDFGLNDTSCFLAFHIETNNFTGSSVIKYAISNKKNNNDKVDLFFNINFKDRTGLNGLTALTTYTITPNPVLTKLTIYRPHTLADEDALICNALGQILAKQKLSSLGSTSIDLATLEKGIYYLRIVTSITGEPGNLVNPIKFIKN